MSRSVGIVGARGYVGAELIRLVAAHPQFELAFVSSRELAGQRVADHFEGVDGIDPELRYVSPSNDELPGLGADAVVLALPNGKAAACVATSRARCRPITCASCRAATSAVTRRRALWWASPARGTSRVR